MLHIVALTLVTSLDNAALNMPAIDLYTQRPLTFFKVIVNIAVHRHAR